MYRVGFIIEQSLGHVTHGQNLRSVIAQDPSIEACWGLPQYTPQGFAALLPLYSSNWSLRASVQARRQLAHFQRQAPMDVLFLHTQVVSMLARDWMHRIPSVISLDATPRQVDELGQYYNHQANHPWLEHAKQRFVAGTLRAAQHLVTWAQWTADGLIEEYGVPREKVTVIPPGIVLEKWSRPANVQKDPDTAKILFVGGDFSRKGGEDLLDVFRRLQAEHAAGLLAGAPRTLELHLVTRQPLAAEPGVIVHNNFVPNDPGLIRLYHEADIFCLPTYGDCLPMALAEAGAVGLPVVSTHVGAIAEIVRDQQTGLLVQPGNREMLHAALRRFLCDANLRAEFGRQGCAWVKDHFTADRNARDLLLLLKQVADQGRDRRLRA